MFIVNAWAQQYFSQMLHEHVEGKTVGMRYFIERGFREDTIRKFQLGYSLDQRDALYQQALRKGYKKEYLEKTHDFYRKYGGKTIVIARFVPIVRTLAPFVAGMGKMHYYYFIVYNLLGAAAWVGIFCYAGYFFGDIPFVQENLKLVLVAIIVISILPAVIETLRAKLKANKR